MHAEPLLHCYRVDKETLKEYYVNKTGQDVTHWPSAKYISKELCDAHKIEVEEVEENKGEELKPDQEPDFNQEIVNMQR